MKRIVAAAGLAAMLSAPLAARQKPPVFVETQAVKDKPAVVLDPAKAYVLLRSEASVPLYLMKVPTSEDRATYDKLRADALIEAHGKYVKKLASYERDRAAAAKTPGMQVGDRPIEPAEQNFEFTQFGMLAAVGIGPLNRFAKSGISTYLQEVTPGTYRIYGFLAVAAGAAPTGSCFCMGTVKFDAKAGEITDLGVVGKAAPIDRPAGDSSYPAVAISQRLFEPAGIGMPLDPRLANYTVARAKFRPAGKLPNYFGLQITRMPEMPGVLRYDRDRIVDLTASAN